VGIGEVYIAHASSLTAALREGALRAAASRPCLGTLCRGLFRSRQQPCGCAPLGRTSCDGQSALPRHFVPRRGLHHNCGSGMENGLSEAKKAVRPVKMSDHKSPTKTRYFKNGLLARSLPILLAGPCPQMKVKSSGSGSSFSLIAVISASWSP